MIPLIILTFRIVQVSQYFNLCKQIILEVLKIVVVHYV